MHSVLVNTSHVYVHSVFILSPCVPLEPGAVQGIEVMSISNTSVEVNWMASVAPTAWGNTINGYQIEVFIVDVVRNVSNRTEPVDNVNSTVVKVLCELEFCGNLSLYQPTACVQSVVSNILLCSCVPY